MPDKFRCTKCRKLLTPYEAKLGPKRIYGICPDCEAEITRQLKGPVVGRYLETLGVPALVVNRDLRVIAYNEICLEKLCDSAPKPNGLLPGEFLECHNATLPERCGASPACLDCALRQTASHTLRTGETQKYVPAVITGKKGGLRVRREFMVSTEKLGDMAQITVETWSP